MNCSREDLNKMMVAKGIPTKKSGNGHDEV